MNNYDKLILGRTLNGHDGSHYGNDCFNYGSVGGCDEYCPALNNLECDVWTENIDFMNDDLIQMYKNKETKGLKMNKELIEEILEDLEKLKDKCYDVNFEIAGFKDASHFSFTFDKIEGLEEHLQEALERIKQKEKI